MQAGLASFDTSLTPEDFSRSGIKANKVVELVIMMIMIVIMMDKVGELVMMMIMIMMDKVGEVIA